MYAICNNDQNGIRLHEMLHLKDQQFHWNELHIIFLILFALFSENSYYIFPTS